MFQIDENPIFNYYPVAGLPKAIVSIPHSGMEIPAEFKEFLIDDEYMLNRDIDYMTHKLLKIDQLVAAGIAVIEAKVHRCCVDLNRRAVDCVLNWKSNSHGQKLVIKEPSIEQEEFLRQKYYAPYFHMLKSTIQFLESKLDEQSSNLINVLDFHSMPSKPTAFHLQKNPNQSQHRPMICLSDLFASSCTPSYLSDFTKNLSKNFEVDLNNPYIGGYLTQYISGFKTNVLQLEVNRSIYMNENKIEIHEKFDDVSAKLTQAVIDSLV